MRMTLEEGFYCTFIYRPTGFQSSAVCVLCAWIRIHNWCNRLPSPKTKSLEFVICVPTKPMRRNKLCVRMNYKKSYGNRLKRIFFIDFTVSLLLPSTSHGKFTAHMRNVTWNECWTEYRTTTMMMLRMTSLTLTAIDNANGSNCEQTMVCRSVIRYEKNK